MRSMQRRLERLATQFGVGSGCPLCGRHNGTKPPWHCSLVVIFLDGQTSDTPDHCPGCGAQQVVHITFDDPRVTGVS